MTNTNFTPSQDRNTNNNNSNKNQQQTLEKAMLYSLDGKEYDFEFMFNPREISINKQANVTEDRGATTENQGIPKVSFAYPKATVITINDIVFDVYENEKKDLGEKIAQLAKTVKFIRDKKRPPIYIFGWGKIKYLRCYVESVNYKLTLFLPDGTPVRATASISLKEIDPSSGESNTSTQSQPEREVQSRWRTPQASDWESYQNNP